MGIFDFLKEKDINDFVEKFNNTPGAILLDVRNADEYKEGHIPGSINIPDRDIQTVREIIPDLNTPVFVYYLGGSKSWNVTKIMKELGYKKVKNIGGISKYTGVKEK